MMRRSGRRKRVGLTVSGLEEGNAHRLAEDWVRERQEVPVAGRQLSSQRLGRSGDRHRLQHPKAESL